MSLNILHEIYAEAYQDPKQEWYWPYQSDAYDTYLYEGKMPTVEVLIDEKDPEDDWNHRLVFKYKDKIYACPYREGSYGIGICFYKCDLKEVTAKVKEVTYYE